jgi:2-isopropylmalate synthase
VEALVDALASIGHQIKVLDYHEHALTVGADARAAAYVEAEVNGQVWWGVAIDANITSACLRAVVNAANRGVPASGATAS